MFRQKLPSTVFIPNPLSYQSDAVSPVLDSKSIIAVANWQRPEKRLDRTLEIFSGVSRQVGDAHLVLAGPVRQIELSDLIEKHRLSPESVEAVGQQENVEPFYLRSRVLLHASELEGFGLILTEAGMHGLPRVTMDSPGLDEVIEHGVDGYLVEQGDTQAAIDYCVSLLTDDSLCQEVSVQALCSVEKFQLGIIGKRWEWLVNLALSTSSVSEKKRLMYLEKKDEIKKRRDANKDEINKKDRERYQVNKEAIDERNNRYRLKNRDEINRKKRETYHKNRDELNRQARERYHAKNPQSKKYQSKKYLGLT